MKYRRSTYISSICQRRGNSKFDIRILTAVMMLRHMLNCQNQAMNFQDTALGFQLDATTVFKIAAGDANGLGLLASDLRDLDFADLGT